MNKFLGISLAIALAFGGSLIFLHCDENNDNGKNELTPTPVPSQTPLATPTGNHPDTPTARPSEQPEGTPTPEATDTPTPRTSCDFYAATGIIPLEGHWTVDGTGKNFTLSNSGGQLWVDPDWDDIIEGGWDGNSYPTYGSRDVIDGSFAFQWGELGGTHCPNDGFCFAGHFTTPSTATVIWQKHYDCEIISSLETTATLR